MAWRAPGPTSYWSSRYVIERLGIAGLDSLMAVEFSTRLQSQFGDDFAFSPTLLYDYPTVNAISGYLLELVTELDDYIQKNGET